VRFGQSPRTEATREDGLQMPLQPARRPRRPYWQWYLLLAAAALPVIAAMLWLLRQVACMP
jgi:ferric-dicitrate binding protein FerR (iron transport regulator)